MKRNFVESFLPIISDTESQGHDTRSYMKEFKQQNMHISISRQC